MPAVKFKLSNRRPLVVTAILAAVMLAGAAWWFITGAGNETAAISPSDRTLVALGKSLYAQQCAACHGAKLEGQKNWRRPLPGGGLRAPPHDASGHTWHHPDSMLFTITKRGGGAIAPPGFKSNMPAFKGALSDREIRAVLAFIKSRWPERIQKISQRINRQARKAR